MTKWTIYNDRGLFTGASINCPNEHLDQNIPDGHGCYMGEIDIMSQRIDMKTGLLVDYQPPKPSENYHWDPIIKRWAETATLEKAQLEAWEMVKASRDKAEASNFEFDGVFYQPNSLCITRAALSAVIAQLSSTPFSIKWTAADNSVVILDSTKMQGLALALNMHIDRIREIGHTLRAAVASARTPAEAYSAALWPTL